MVEATALILAGGLSTRMGTDKAFLSLDGRESFVATIARRLQDYFPEVLISTNRPEPYLDLGLPTVADLQPGGGPLRGIQAGLQAARFNAVFVVACDMPFIAAELAAKMVGLLAGYDAVVPRREGRVEPLHAVYTKTCLPAITSYLESGERKVTGFYPRVQICYLDMEGLSGDEITKVFTNINTPEELAAARRLDRKDKGGDKG